ncbi:MAG: very short patch repair endonuclease [Synergistaceae bacterium]|nr:very short patch repair endonuclease [Synergistaceae bacterium]
MAGLAKKTPRTAEEQRSYTMSRVRQKDTAIELTLRKRLWREGIRYRKNYRKLPGSPDIAITKYQVAIFCDGEFWHGKGWETKRPKIRSNPEYWTHKIERNMRRDSDTDRKLQRMGWSVLRFWGADIEKDLDACVEEVKEAIFQSQIDAYDRVPEYRGEEEV